MKKYKDSIKTVLVLGIIALISGLLLSMVNSITQIDENAVLAEKIAKAYPDSAIKREISVEGYENLSGSVILKAYVAEDNAVIILSHSKKAYSSAGLDMLVIIKDNIIIGLFKYKASETPGVGSTVLNSLYLNAYIGVDISKYNVIELNKGADTESIKNVDAISGATITSKAVNSAVNGAIKFYQTTSISEETISGGLNEQEY